MRGIHSESRCRRGRELGLAISTAAGLSLALACGSDDPGAGDPAPAAASPAAAAADPDAPQILRVHLTPSRPAPGQTISASVDAEDPNGDDLTLGYTWRVAGQPIAGGESEVIVPLTARKGETISVEVKASDGSSLSEPHRAETIIGNRPPAWVSLRLDRADEVPPGTSLTAVPEAEDPDGDPIEYRYTWYVNGSPSDASGPSFGTAGLRRGDEIYASVEVSDNDFELALEHQSPMVRVGNADPKFISAPGAFSPDGVFRYTLEARDPDGDRSLRFRLVSGPAGMHVGPILGQLEWRPEASQVGKHEVIVAATDSHGGEGQQHCELDERESGGESAHPASP